MNRVKGKIALITGGSSGIGARTAELLLEEGAKVLIADLSPPKNQADTHLSGCQFYRLDVSDPQQWEEVIHAIDQQFGRIDILFNNAGITGFNDILGPQDPENISIDAWHQVHRVNLDGVFLGCKHGIHLMKKWGGSIINMSSRSGIVGTPHAAAYASSKAAIRNHTKTVALYCAEKGYKVRCNSLNPAAIKTPIWDPMLGIMKEKREKLLSEIEQGIPLGKMGEPLDVAYAALYLASDESRYVTGIELNIDGGILAGTTAKPKKALSL